MTSALTLYVFWFSGTFCSEFCFNFSEGTEIIFLIERAFFDHVL